MQWKQGHQENDDWNKKTRNDNIQPPQKCKGLYSHSPTYFLQLKHLYTALISLHPKSLLGTHSY